jgi:hypothetical protein
MGVVLIYGRIDFGKNGSRPSWGEWGMTNTDCGGLNSTGAAAAVGAGLAGAGAAALAAAPKLKVAIASIEENVDRFIFV